MINKKAVQKILNSLAKAPKPLNEEGSLSIVAFNKLPEIKKAVEELKELKVTKKWLGDNGFIAAAMVLTIN